MYELFDDFILGVYVFYLFWNDLKEIYSLITEIEASWFCNGIF